MAATLTQTPDVMRIDVRGLGKSFQIGSTVIEAVRDVSFSVRRGEFVSARAAYDRVLGRSPGRKEALEGKEELRRRELARRLEQAEKLLSEGRSSQAYDAFGLLLLEDPTLKRAQDGKEEAKRRMILPSPDAKRP